MRYARVFRVAPLLIALASSIACGRDAPDQGPASASAAAFQPECERLGYPCTWAEVDRAVVEETLRIGRAGSRQLSAGGSTADLAATLGRHPDVTDLSWDSRSVRFRHRRGQFMTVADGRAFEPGTRAMPVVVAAQVDQPAHTPVGRSGPGKPKKEALILTPFEWEFGEAEARDLIVRLATYKDYCPAQGSCSQYIERNHRTNSWATNPTTGAVSRAPSGIRIVDRGVTYRDFMGWEAFDLIHVATHGFVHCYSATDGHCPIDLNLIATGAFFVEGVDPHPVGFVGTDAVYELRDTGRYLSTVSARGVEFLIKSDPDACVNAGPAPTPTTPLGNNNFTYGELRCGQDPILEMVTNVFFEDKYGGGLADTFVFLNGCETLTIDRLSDHLKQGGNTTVLGWARSPGNNEALMASRAFYRHFLRQNRSARDAYDRVLAEAALPPLSGGIQQKHVAGFLVRGESATGVPLLQAAGEDKTRGRELVGIYDPHTGEELRDGSTLLLVGAPGDNASDKVDLVLEVSGVNEAEDPAGYPMRLRVGDRALATAFTAREKVDDTTWRYRGTIDLGFEVRPGHVADIEIRTDMPDGGFSRWIYEDIRLVGSRFKLNVGGAATGSQEGWIWVSTVSSPSADPGSGLCHAVIHFVPAVRGSGGLAGLTALPTFGLTIGALGGLRTGEYPVADDETHGMGNNFEQRSANPDTFFAALGAKLADPDPEVAAFFSFVSFFSRGGTVSIDYIDSERIAGTFRVTVRALAPLDGWVNDRFEWREATVTGIFAGPFAPDPSRGVRINRPSQEIYRCRPGA